MQAQFAPIFLLVEMAERAEADFRALRKAEKSRITNAYSNEVAVKLRQLRYCLQRIEDLLKRFSYAKFAAHGDILQELSFYTEAFYWFAWRTRQACARADGLSDFSCDGVRDVRNHLIEHPEKHVDGLSQAGVFGIGPGGPMIKHPAIDKGLFGNAEQFYQNLLAMLERNVDPRSGLSCRIDPLR